MITIILDSRQDHVITPSINDPSIFNQTLQLRKKIKVNI